MTNKKKITHVFIPFSTTKDCARCGRPEEGHMTEKEYKHARHIHALKEAGIATGFMLSMYALVFCVGWLAIEAMDERCATNATEMGVEYRYDALNGCRLGIDGKFVNWEFIVVTH